MSDWGLARDEFIDNGHWPHQLYVREARRMVGAYVMTENELLKRRPTPQSIGMGSYTMDSHNVQRYIIDGHVQNEGISASAPRARIRLPLARFCRKTTMRKLARAGVCLQFAYRVRLNPQYVDYCLYALPGCTVAYCFTGHRRCEDEALRRPSKSLPSDNGASVGTFTQVAMMPLNLVEKCLKTVHSTPEFYNFGGDETVKLEGDTVIFVLDSAPVYLLDSQTKKNEKHQNQRHGRNSKACRQAETLFLV